MADDLSDRLKKALEAIAEKAAKAKTLKVGFFAGSTEPNGASTPMVAAIQEYGAPSKNIPPRPFFRMAIVKNQAKWKKALATQLKANQGDAGMALNQLGEEIIGDVQDSIRDFKSPPNADSTIKKKGFDNPLIDTGVMLNSVTKRVD